MAHGDIVLSAGTYDLDVKIGAAVFPTLTTIMALGMDFLRANAITVNITRRTLVWNCLASRSTAHPTRPKRLYHGRNNHPCLCSDGELHGPRPGRRIVAGRRSCRRCSPAQIPGIQIGSSMGAAPLLVSRRAQTEKETARRDVVARYVHVKQEVCWHCARPDHYGGRS